MRKVQLVNSVALLGEEVADETVRVTYDVLGWTVVLSRPMRAPIQGPEEVSISKSTVVPVGGGKPGGRLIVERIPGTSASEITTEVLRSIPLADARQRMTRLQHEYRQARVSLPNGLHGERDWAAFAKVYADLVAQGHRTPLQHMVRATGMSRNTLSARVRRAREKGLLTPPRGKNLGMLTSRAERLLEE